MKTTASNVIRWSGLAAMGAGIIFLVIQVIHPADVLASVTTGRWATVHYLGVTMSFLGVLGVAGIYASQVEKAGWLGLAGYLLFSLFWALTMAFQFVEALISPVLATEAPRFVEGFLGIVNGTASEIDLGALPTVYALTGFGGYVLGGVLLGIATFRAGVLPRWAGGLLVIAAASVIVGGLLPHPIDRLLAVPMGLALAWLGYALWSERRENVSGALPTRSSPELSHTRAR